MRLFGILVLGVVATLGACKSTSATPQYSAVPCTCGTLEADYEGCAHPLCVQGQRNPDNPDCVCGPMKIGGK